jgi:hypothetical protein
MKTLALSFYCLAAIADLAALWITAADIHERIRRLRAYELPLRTGVALMWNADPGAVGQLVSLLGPEETERRRREADNELRQAVSHIAAIAGVWTTPGRLVWALLLLVVGTIAGAVGNIMGTF